jgi:altronate hydrolase
MTNSKDDKFITLNPNDNVAVAISTLAPDTGLAIERIPRGHKVALNDIAEGSDVLKFGNFIGRAT